MRTYRSRSLCGYLGGDAVEEWLVQVRIFADVIAQPQAVRIEVFDERRAGDRVFVSTAFTTPSGRLITFWHLSLNGRAAARRYLDKRGLHHR